MMTTSVALNDGPAFRLGEVVRVRGEKATLFAISILGGQVTVKYLATGRKETVRTSELQTEAQS